MRRMSDGDLMTLSTTEIGTVAVVTVAGEVDLHTAGDLMATVDEIFTRPGLSAVVIDLTGVVFLGSSGLGTLAELHRRAPASPRPDDARIPVRVVSAGDNRAVTRPWETMNLKQILPLYPDVAAAMADLAG